MKLSVSLTGCHLDITLEGGLEVYLSDGDFFYLGYGGMDTFTPVKEGWRSLPWVWRDGDPGII